jgi:hypothetical protein
VPAGLAPADDSGFISSCTKSHAQRRAEQVDKVAACDVSGTSDEVIDW